MGWSRGSDLFASIAEIIEAVVANEADRREIYEEIIAAFEDHDCDTLMECTGIDSVLDDLLEEIYDSDDDESDEEDDEWPDGGREDFS